MVSFSFVLFLVSTFVSRGGFLAMVAMVAVGVVTGAGVFSGNAAAQSVAPPGCRHGQPMGRDIPLASTSAENLADAIKNSPDWEYLWGDEFNSADPVPNPKMWGTPHGYLINREAQFYTNNRRENARVENGKCIIEARLEDYAPAAAALEQLKKKSPNRVPKPLGSAPRYTSAMLSTRDKITMRHGRLEVRAKLPAGRGLWPAFWLLETPAPPKDPWPVCGEIDVMEQVAHSPGFIHTNFHSWDADSKTKRFSVGNYVGGLKPYEGFHVWRMDWSPEKIDVFYDTLKIITIRPQPDKPERWPYNKPYYFIMNLAVGGSWGGEKGIDDAVFPARLEVDYVRVWREKK